MKIKKVDGAKIEIDMTPMIDICFQLLTFFVFILNASRRLLRALKRSFVGPLFTLGPRPFFLS